MTVSEHAASVQAVALQVTKLNADGSPMQGTTTSFVTNAFMKLSFTPEYTKGIEVEEKAADGSVCVYYQADDVLKRVTLSLDICGPDPALYQMLIGGDTLMSSGSDSVALGYSAPLAGTRANPNGCAIEVWSRAIVNGRPSPDLPYWRWVFPYAKLYMSGERTMENGALANNFTGWGVGNTNYGAGAAGTWTYQTDAAFAFLQVATAPIGMNEFVTVGPPPTPVNQVDTITISGSPTGGTFLLGYQGVSTSSLAWNITASQLQSALVAMASIGAGNATVADVGTTPPVITLGTATSGGAFTSGTYFWVVTAIGTNGESLASNELTATLTSNQEQPINWTAVGGATGYNIYRGTTTGVENHLISSVGAVTTYTDTGTAGVVGLPPTTHGPFQVTFAGSLAGTQLPPISVPAVSLTGGSNPTVTSVITTAGVA
jgi:hypothetical protein